MMISRFVIIFYIFDLLLFFKFSFGFSVFSGFFDVYFLFLQKYTFVFFDYFSDFF